MSRSIRELALDICANAVGGCIGAVVIALLYYGFYHVAPVVETMISPVVRFGPVTDVYRDEIKACFTLHPTKLADATPVTYNFTARAPLSQRINTSPYLTDENYNRAYGEAAKLEKHAVGQRWARRYCFEIPQTVADWQPMTVNGIAFHRRHWGYLTPTPVPVFTVPALSR